MRPMIEVIEHRGRLIEISAQPEDIEGDPDDAWTYLLECWDITSPDGEGELFTMRRDGQGRLLLETIAPAVDVSVMEAVARVAERDLPERHRWTG